ncbi:hypothetical protein AOLI_G00116890 [Acnodon oligacanthus]
MGRWYEIQKLPNAFQKGECAQATYTLQDGVVLVLNQELLTDGMVSSIEGTAKAKDPSEPAKLEVSFFEGVPPGNYWVLSTDYENYSLVFGCSDYLGLFHVEFAWILSRSRSLPKETLSELQGILTSNGIDINTLTSTDQDPERCSSMPQSFLVKAGIWHRAHPSSSHKKEKKKAQRRPGVQSERLPEGFCWRPVESGRALLVFFVCCLCRGLIRPAEKTLGDLALDQRLFSTDCRLYY